MTRVAMNPDAADWAAVRLADAAQGLRDSAKAIAGHLHLVGRKDSPAPNDIFRAAELLQALSRDLRARAAIARAAEGWPDPIAAIALNIPLWTDVLDSLRRTGHQDYWAARRSKEIVDSVESALNIGHGVKYGSRLVYHTFERARYDLLLPYLEGHRLSAAERQRRSLLKTRRNLHTARMVRAEKALGQAQHLGETAAVDALTVRVPGLVAVGRVAGAGLTVFAVGVALVDGVRDVKRQDWGGAASNTAMLVGTAMMASGFAAPVGAALVAGSLIYENRAELGKAAAWVGRKISRANGRTPADANEG